MNNLLPTAKKPDQFITATTGGKTTSGGGWLAAATTRFWLSRLNRLATGLFLIIILVCLLAPVISTQLLKLSPQRTQLLNTFKPPGNQENSVNGTIIHWLGTDELGRDTLARLLYAGGASLLVGWLVMLVALGIGTPLGLLAGYYGGRVDDLINALIGLVINLPLLYVFMVLGQIFTPDLIFLALLFGALSWAGVARHVRALTLSLRAREYVIAAQSTGASAFWIIRHHLLPHLSSILLVLAGNEMAAAMLSEAALSFLGFGLRDPEVSWGKLLSRSSEYLTYAGNENSLLVIGPGLAIFITTLSIYLIADGLRDAFDPALDK